MSIRNLEDKINSFICEPIDDKVVKMLEEIDNLNLPSLKKYLSKHFIEVFPLSYPILYEYAKSMEGNSEICFEACSKLLAFPNLTDIEVKNVLKLMKNCVKKVKNKYIYYNKELVDELQNKPKINSPIISFSMTTCKRFDLFEKTMNSFLNCCKDVRKIDYWFIVDDNSDEKDREKMKRMYPFVEFYFKSIEEKGHPQSMNIILEKISSPYLFHMEDDFLYFKPDNYITNCLNVLSSEKNIGQCLINRIYSETENDPHRIVGGERKNTTSGLRYMIHEYAPNNTFERKKFVAKYGNCVNEAYWPHFSFRPGLNKFWVWKKIGKFNEKISHFEMEFAHRYVKNGYVTAFFDDISCLHIGRLTSERNDTNKKNAYELNNEAQFSGKEEKLRSELRSECKFKGKCKTLILNLDKREDRWENFKKNELKKIAFLDPQRYSAVNGTTLKPTLKLASLFFGNDYGYRAGMVGCALSHLKMWTELIKEKEIEFYVVLEDDVSICSNFEEKFNELMQNLPSDWELVYLGASMRPRYIENNKILYDQTQPIHIEKWSIGKSLGNSLGGTFGYIIRKQGAQKMLNFVENTRMTNCIDTMMQKGIEGYYIVPHLVKSDLYGNTGIGGNLNTDTDIGKCFVRAINKKDIDELVKGYIIEKNTFKTDPYFYPIEGVGSIELRSRLFDSMDDILN